MPTHSASPEHSTYDQIVRRELSAFLRGDQAHASLDAAVKNMPASLLDKKPAGSPHNAWQMLEHIRIALHDLLEFCTNPKYEAPPGPRDIGRRKNRRNQPRPGIIASPQFIRI